MKAFIDKCTSVMTVVSGKKRGRALDIEQQAPHYSQNAKRMKMVTVKQETDQDDVTEGKNQDYSIESTRQPPTSTYNPPRPGEGEGIFSSSPITFFSRRVPEYIYHLYQENGGRVVPETTCFEIIRTIKNQDSTTTTTTDKSILYNQVDLYLVDGPDDPLRWFFERSTIILMFDCKWVEDSIKKGEILSLREYIVSGKAFPDRPSPRINNTVSDTIQAFNIDIESNTNGGISSQYTPATSSQISRAVNPNHSTRYRMVHVNSTDFKSQNALVAATHEKFRSHSATRPMNTSLQPHTSSSAPSRSRSTQNAEAGPSRPQISDVAHELSEPDFLPFDPSSSSNGPSSPISDDIPLHQNIGPPSIPPFPHLPIRFNIPHRKLDRRAVSKYKKTLKTGIYLDLKDTYYGTWECENKEDRILGSLIA